MQEVKPTRADSDNHIAIASFDGESPRIIKATQLRICVPTRSCIQFWATIIACFVAIAVGVFLMIFQGPDSTYYSVGLALLGLATGVLIPGNPLFCGTFFCVVLISCQQDQISRAWWPRRRPNPRPLSSVKARMTKKHRHAMCQVQRCIHVGYPQLTGFKLEQWCNTFDTIQNNLIVKLILKETHSVFPLHLQGDCLHLKK